MMLFIAIFCLVLTNTFAGAEEASEPPPRIFSVLLERNPNGGDGIVDDNFRHTRRLRECGYQVVDVDAQSTAELHARLGHYAPLGPDETFLVEGHGRMQGRTLRLGDTSEDAFSAAELLSTIQYFSAHATVHVDVCHAGGAAPHAGTLGLSLAAGSSVSRSGNENTELMIQVLCSRIGDCVLWRSIDRDGDGQITEAEWRAYLTAHTSSVGPQTLFSVELSDERHDAIQAFREECRRRQGATRAINTTVRVVVDYQDFTGPHSDVPYASFARHLRVPAADFTSVEEASDYYRSYLERSNRAIAWNVRFRASGSDSTYLCERTGGHLAYADMSFHNQPLQSSRCAGGPAISTRAGRSGLAHLEGGENLSTH